LPNAWRRGWQWSAEREAQRGAGVRVLDIVGGFSVIARDGVKLGYVPSDALAKIQ
jgi:hypothetical protein